MLRGPSMRIRGFPFDLNGKSFREQAPEAKTLISSKLLFQTLRSLVCENIRAQLLPTGFAQAKGIYLHEVSDSASFFLKPPPSRQASDNLPTLMIGSHQISELTPARCANLWHRLRDSQVKAPEVRKLFPLARLPQAVFQEGQLVQAFVYQGGLGTPYVPVMPVEVRGIQRVSPFHPGKRPRAERDRQVLSPLMIPELPRSIFLAGFQH
jgi:hypothetical protein